MQKEVFRTDGLHWIDVINPSRPQLEALAAKYGLLPTSVQDCLEPEHLPKFEKTGDTVFLILRAYDENCATDADSVQNLTRKLAMFIGKGFILTVHRKDQQWIEGLRTHWAEAAPKAASSLNPVDVSDQLLTGILKSVIVSYQAPLEKIQNEMDSLEKRVFTNKTPGKTNITKGYLLKRRSALIERMLRQTKAVILRFGPGGEKSTHLFQDVNETVERWLFVANELEENLKDLISTQLALHSQRTNEVMRVLTLISLVFLPCNFIAGVYGMNFQYMPELGWKLGYPFSLLLMVVVTLSIFGLILRRGWLK